MQNDASTNNYPIELIGGANNTYFFATTNGIGYHVKFVPSDYLFDAFPDLQIHLFEMIISVIYNPSGGRLPADTLTAPTIVTIFNDFYTDKDQAIVFVCDSNDRRESARARRFTSWFYYGSGDDLAKIDRKVSDGERITFLSMILN